MPRGENEAFKKSQGRFSRISKDELRKTASKGGQSKPMTMYDFKRLAHELNSEVTDGGKTKGEIMLNNLQNEAAHGNVKAMKLWLEIMQFGEPKNIDITSGGERLPDIKIEMPTGSPLARSEDEINE